MIRKCIHRHVTQETSETSNEITLFVAKLLNLLLAFATVSVEENPDVSSSLDGLAGD